MIRTITEEAHINLDPPADRTPTPADEIARFLESRKAFQCLPLCAVVTPEQCGINRRTALQEFPGACIVCRTCNRLPDTGLSAVPTAPKKRRKKSDNPNSPWRKNPNFIPNHLRTDEVTNGTLCPGLPLAETGRSLSPVPDPRSPVPPSKAGRQAGRQAGRVSPPQQIDPIVMRIFDMVQQRLQACAPKGVSARRREV